MTRASLALLLSLPLLGGCSSDGSSNYSQIWQVIRNSVSGRFDNRKVTRDQAASIPYASMGWQLKGDNQNIIVLATDSGGRLLWTSAAHIVLVTQEGRLVRSVGLGHDLGSLTPRGGGDLPAPAQALHGAYSSSRLADYPDIDRYGVGIDCRTHVAGRQTIASLGRAIATTRVDEDCDSPTLRWHFTDHYWVDGDGTVWRTSQHIHPSQEELETVLFRPPG